MMVEIQGKTERISAEEFFRIARRLEDKHALFYRFWEMGKPEFNRSISTACVLFDKEGYKTEFFFNPDFWDKLTDYERDFVICHEMLHIVLNHGSRVKDYKNNNLSNTALDIVVNHTLIRRFSFDREKISFAKDLCWVDTVFEEDIPKDEYAFEYYLRKLQQEAQKRPELLQIGSLGSGGSSGQENGDGGASGLPSILDEHKTLEEEEFKEIVKELDEILSNEEKKGTLRDLIDDHYQDDTEEGNQSSRGRGEGIGHWTFVDPTKIKVAKKRKWEEVIKDWAKPFMKQEVREVEQWAREHRRLVGWELSSVESAGMFLPSEMDIEDVYDDIDMIDVFFFLDVSGSCSGLKSRFMKAAKSLPEDRFNARFFLFADRVKEISLDKPSNNNTGWGTSFDILETKIQYIVNKENTKYPHACFVITDGMGNTIRPEYPDRWFWFLSRSNRYCIPNKSHIYMLKDFE